MTSRGRRTLFLPDSVDVDLRCSQSAGGVLLRRWYAPNAPTVSGHGRKTSHCEANEVASCRRTATAPCRSSLTASRRFCGHPPAWSSDGDGGAYPFTRAGGRNRIDGPINRRSSTRPGPPRSSDTAPRRALVTAPSMSWPTRLLTTGYVLGVRSEAARNGCPARGTLASQSTRRSVRSPRCRHQGVG